MAANGANGNNNVDGVDRNAHLLEENLDKLTEKRAATREQAFTALNNEFKLNYCYDFVDKTRQTLIDAAVKGLKKGAPSEQVLACETISLICITLGLEAESLFKETVHPLLEIMQHSSDEYARIAAMNTFAFGTFITVDEATSIEYMKELASLFSDVRTSALVKSAAIGAWSLLLSTISKKYAYDTLIPDHLATVVSFLNDESVDLRVDAGEALALLIEVAKDMEEDFSIENLAGYVDVDEMMDMLFKLAHDKSKTRSRKDKLKQRLPFKEIVSFVEENEIPVEDIEIKFTKMKFSSWSQLKQLDSVRDLLAIGFQTHFQHNELLQDIFDVRISEDAKKKGLSAVEKRMMQSPSSPLNKMRTKNLSKQRDVRERATESFLADED